MYEFFRKLCKGVTNLVKWNSSENVFSLFFLAFDMGITRRERPKSAPYLRLKNIQGTTIGKIWKNFFFKKNF